MTRQRLLIVAASGAGAMMAVVAGAALVVAYALVCAATVMGVRRVVKRLDVSGVWAVPAESEQPDPYELAYLRAGPNEVKRLVILTLIERGYLRVVDRAKHLVGQAPGRRALEHLDAVERQFFNRFFAQAWTLREVL